MDERTAIPQVASDEPAVYHIRVLGRLGDDWRDRFDGFQLSILDGSPPTTALRGLLADQAALMGVLAHLHASRVTLLGVERVDRSSADTVGEDPPKGMPSARQGSSRQPPRKHQPRGRSDPELRDHHQRRQDHKNNVK